tara:strand:- start:4010 stop:4327 length:318 start_codon:yes stop_codon:yes gene_type:complete
MLIALTIGRASVTNVSPQEKPHPLGFQRHLQKLMQAHRLLMLGLVPHRSPLMGAYRHPTHRSLPTTRAQPKSHRLKAMPARLHIQAVMVALRAHLRPNPKMRAFR